MKCLNVPVLKFVGGPFDGFTQPIDTDLSELPEAVAIPMNKRASRVFGVGCSQSDRVAIYALRQEREAAEYRFRSLRSARGA